MEKELGSPKVVRRACGGCLALSPFDQPLRIGVTAESEEEAVTKYWSALSAWQQTLNQAKQACV